MKSRRRNTGGRVPIAGCVLQTVAILVVGGCTLDTLIGPEAATAVSGIAAESGREIPQAPAAAAVGAPESPSHSLIFRCNRRTELSGRSPLIIVDGSRYDAMRFDVLAAPDIERIEVIKPAGAAEVYGEDGKNGVIVIVTRHGGRDGKPDGLPGEPSN